MIILWGKFATADKRTVEQRSSSPRHVTPGNLESHIADAMLLKCCIALVKHFQTADCNTKIRFGKAQSYSGCDVGKEGQEEHR